MSNDVWETIPFTSAVDVISDEGKRLKQRDYLEQGNIPVIDQGEAFIGGYTNDEQMAYKGELPVIIFGDHTRRIKLVSQPFAVGADGVKILRPKSLYRPKFFYYFLQSLEIPSRGYSRHFQFLRNFKFVKASPEDQDRVVAEIEKQFSRLDEAVASLKRTQANLKRYKAAVLKAAVEGKLTEQWRKVHTDVEPADQLLKRILVERRAKWEAEELAKMKAKGSLGARHDSPDLWKKKYKEPARPDMASLPELPDRWVWATVEQLANVMLGKMLDKTKHQTGDKMAYLRNVNIRWGRIDSDDLLEMYFENDEIERYGLKNGDVLVCEGGEPGRAAVWKGIIPEMKYQKALHRVRCCSGYDSRMLEVLLEQMAKSGRLEKWFTGSTIKHFTKESFVQLPVPLPSMTEQKVILEEIDRHLSVTEELETTIETNLKRAERLRQTILQRAFSSGLV